jgi:hypothetical protein
MEARGEVRGGRFVSSFVGAVTVDLRDLQPALSLG